MVERLLIQDARLRDGQTLDVRLAGGRVIATGSLAPELSERVIPARGGLLLPGLHDHHLHLAATAAARSSVSCGPPVVMNAQELAQVLASPGSGWLRGVGYHDSVAGPLHRRWIDSVAPGRPVRVQHRSGRMWIFNTMGMDLILASGVPPSPGLDRQSGRLFDDDAWLQRVLGGRLPPLAPLSADYARHGVVGLTEMGPTNGVEVHGWISAQQAAGTLLQRVTLAGTAALAKLDYNDALRLGPVKAHLHEAHLPDHDVLIAMVRAAHAQGRAIAIHCVTEVELVYALAAIAAAGAHLEDRIEHASVTPDALLAAIAALGLMVVGQPHFIAERGDAYRRDIPAEAWPHLYRLRSFLEAGVPVAGGSDAPYGQIDPWAAMASAVSRRTREGAILGADEALMPEQALDLFLADPLDLRSVRKISVGVTADLCLLDQPWSVVRNDLSGAKVVLTLISGRVIYDGVDQPPA